MRILNNSLVGFGGKAYEKNESMIKVEEFLTKIQKLLGKSGVCNEWKK